MILVNQREEMNYHQYDACVCCSTQENTFAIHLREPVATSVQTSRTRVTV